MDERISLQCALDLLGLPESNVLAFTKCQPPLLNQYPHQEGAMLSAREVTLLREALLAELEMHLNSHPDHLIQILGSQPFIETYHAEIGKTSQGVAHSA